MQTILFTRNGRNHHTTPCITGADAVSGFYGQGKARIYSKVEKSGDARKLLQDFGTSTDISCDAKQDMTSFTIRTIYNDAESRSLAEAREYKWNNMKKKNVTLWSLLKHA